MIFHEIRLLADDSHEISYLILSQKLGKMSQLSSAAVVIGALRITLSGSIFLSLWLSPVVFNGGGGVCCPIEPCPGLLLLMGRGGVGM